MPPGTDNRNLTYVSVSGVKEGFLEEGTFKLKHSLLAILLRALLLEDE